MVVTKYGIVSAPQFLASDAGAKVLEAGGNAVDAAIAANAVMGVTEPYVNGMGGDLFAIYYDAKTAKLYGLNSSGWAPKALTIDYLKAHHIDTLNPIGVHTITIPGCVAGWDALRSRFGTMPFDKLLRSAIFYAENGFPLAEKNARYWIGKAFLNQPGYQQTYMPGGMKPGLGDVFKNPALANSLRQVAERGARCLLSRPAHRSYGEVSAISRRHAHSRGFRRFPARVGRADFHHIPRLERL
jgi:gamma-glutamyltranspeptidase/glutathione hydrolase